MFGSNTHVLGKHEKDTLSSLADFAKHQDKTTYFWPFQKHSEYLLLKDQTGLEISSNRSQSSSCVKINTFAFIIRYTKRNHFRQISLSGLGFQKGNVAIIAFLGNPLRYLSIYTIGKILLEKEQNVYVSNVFHKVQALADFMYNWLPPSQEYLFKYWRIYNSFLSLFSRRSHLSVFNLCSACWNALILFKCVAPHEP